MTFIPKFPMKYKQYDRDLLETQQELSYRYRLSGDVYFLVVAIFFSYFTPIELFYRLKNSNHLLKIFRTCASAHLFFACATNTNTSSSKD